MDIFDKLFPKDLYHSYIIEGDPEVLAKELLGFLENSNYVTRKSLDVLCQNYESFTMGDSFYIKDWHSNDRVTEGKKICIIATKFINREAEQALLKIIEEPKENTHFFIIVPDASLLLDTIISRVHLVKVENSNHDKFIKEVLSFINSSPKERLDMIAQIIKSNKDEDNSGQLRYYATSFVNELENIFYDKFKKDRSNKDLIFILEELHKSRDYLSTPGASVKMILEHLAVVI